MAITEAKISDFGGGTAQAFFSYDDVDMDIVALRAVNNDPSRSLHIVITSPRALSRTLLPGEMLTQSLPPGQHIPYSDGLDYHGVMRHKGVNWSCTLGL